MRPDLTSHSKEAPVTKVSSGTHGLAMLFKLVFTLGLLAVLGSVFYFGSMLEAVADVYEETKIEPMPFDAQLWQASVAEESVESVRLRMIDDLLDNHLQREVHNSFILELLGPPDDHTPDLCGTTHEHWCYHLGTPPTGPMHRGAWLNIRFDDRASVLAFEVVTGADE